MQDLRQHWQKTLSASGCPVQATPLSQQLPQTLRPWRKPWMLPLALTPALKGALGASCFRNVSQSPGHLEAPACIKYSMQGYACMPAIACECLTKHTGRARIASNYRANPFYRPRIIQVSTVFPMHVQFSAEQSIMSQTLTISVQAAQLSHLVQGRNSD